MLSRRARRRNWFHVISFMQRKNRSCKDTSALTADVIKAKCVIRVASNYSFLPVIRRRDLALFISRITPLDSRNCSFTLHETNCLKPVSSVRNSV